MTEELSSVAFSCKKLDSSLMPCCFIPCVVQMLHFVDTFGQFLTRKVQAFCSGGVVGFCFIKISSPFLFNNNFTWVLFYNSDEYKGDLLHCRKSLLVRICLSSD